MSNLTSNFRRVKVLIRHSTFLSLQEINNDVQETEEFSMLAFDSASVTDLLKEFSQTSASRIAIGYLLMVNFFKLFSV